MTKLTTSQIATLKTHRNSPESGVLVGNPRTLAALARRGLAHKIGVTIYVISDDGRAAVTAID